ncbi:uncharacterized protein [Dendrobates tinctorius]|uniref:uncharacterized protein n=1 Tax=Dendrobates tinctorius TaxID=92724 RepID=UPI003CC9867F
MQMISSRLFPCFFFAEFAPTIPPAESAPPAPDPSPLSQTLFTPLPFLFTFVFFTLLSAGGVAICSAAAPLRMILQGLITTPCFPAVHVLAAADYCSSLSCRPSPRSCVHFTAGSPADTGDTHAEDPSGATVRAGITAAITATSEITGAGVPGFDPLSDLHVGGPDTTAHAASPPRTLRGAATTGKVPTVSTSRASAGGAGARLSPVFTEDRAWTPPQVLLPPATGPHSRPCRLSGSAAACPLSPPLLPSAETATCTT